MGGGKNSSAHVVKRSVDGGRTWGAMVELHRSLPSPHCSARVSPEGVPFFDARTNTTIAMWTMADIVSNSTTQSPLWQAESRDAGLTWSLPRPVILHELTAQDVINGTHVPPGSGIQLQSGKHAGRLLAVLILKNHCQDVVIYSDDGGGTWHMSKTRLEHNGEAQVAELAADAVVFDGRSDEGAYKRGVALSDDAGETFSPVRFAADESSGVSCLASLLALPSKSKPAAQASLLFSHPSRKNRTSGVILRSDDGAGLWSKVASATPEAPDMKFGYSSLTLLSSQQYDVAVGLTYETEGANCTATTSACRIMYRKIAVSHAAPEMRT